jgi:hypothetical protein
MDATDGGSLVPAPHVARPLRLLPFQAIRLTPSRIGSPASLRAFSRPDGDVSNRLRRWERRGYLNRDAVPAVYLHEYTSDGFSVRGLVGALDISQRASSRERAAVYPHEGIHADQATDLAERMTQLRAQPAPILLVHRGPERARELMDKVQTAEPLHDYTDRAGQHHRVWAIREPGDLADLEQLLADSTAVIADGHHRYAAYLRMHHEQDTAATSAGLAMLVDQDDTPLHLGAIHRTVSGTDLAGMRAAAETLGAAWAATDHDGAVSALAPATLVLTDGTDWATLTVPDATRPAVDWLHAELLPCLRREVRVRYHHNADSALGAARRGTVAVLMPAPDFDQVLEASAAGSLLPEKATSFQPKPNVGSFIRSLHDG